MKIAIYTAILTLCGVCASIVDDPLYNQGYIILNTVLLASVTLGGVLKYSSQEHVDFRDVYREKDRLQKMKIEDLKLKIIDLEKAQLIKQEQTTQTDYVDVIINGRMES
jgi:hypothetical protein